MARTHHALTTDTKTGPWNRRVHKRKEDTTALAHDPRCPECVNLAALEAEELPTSAEWHDTHEPPERS